MSSIGVHHHAHHHHGQTGRGETRMRG